MFGLGFSEIMLIFVIALIIFGPKKLPDLGKSIGRAMAEFKKASEDFQETVRDEMKAVEKTSGIDEIKKIGQIDLSIDNEQKPEGPESEQSAEIKKPEGSESEQNAEMKSDEKRKKSREAKRNA